LLASARRRLQLGAGEFNQRASLEEAKAIKRKQNGFLLFPFISFYFPESGLFKELPGKEIKKSSPVPDSALRLHAKRLKHAHLRSSPAARASGG
jgi:hypothetical protein